MEHVVIEIEILSIETINLLEVTVVREIQVIIIKHEEGVPTNTDLISATINLPIYV